MVLYDLKKRCCHEIIYILHSIFFYIEFIFGPLYCLFSKPGFFWFYWILLVNGFILAWFHRTWRYVSLCWSNSYFMANAWRNCVSAAYLFWSMFQCLIWMYCEGLNMDLCVCGQRNIKLVRVILQSLSMPIPCFNLS